MLVGTPASLTSCSAMQLPSSWLQNGCFTSRHHIAGMEASEGQRSKRLRVHCALLSVIRTMSGGQPQLQEMLVKEGFSVGYVVTPPRRKTKQKYFINKEEG